MGDRVQHADPREFPGLLRFSGEMLTYDSDRENDREPIRRMGTSVEDGWRESSRRRLIAGVGRGSRTRYSISRSARRSSVCGIVSPSAFAVFRLMTNSYWFGDSTGRVAGFPPRRILST
jgi:hypothetical protein